MRIIRRLGPIALMWMVLPAFASAQIVINPAPYRVAFGNIPDGSVSAPSIAAKSNTNSDTGFFVVSDDVWGFAVAGANALRFGANSVTLYNSYTNETNYESGFVRWNSNRFEVGATALGSGTLRDTYLVAGSGRSVGLYVNGSSTTGWVVSSAGHLSAITDNSFDIGASGANRPRTGYFATSLIQGGALNLGTTTTAGVTLQNTTDAAAGAQQYSPGLSFIGEGWKTTATAASQPVETRFELRPVQGAAAPTYTFALAGRVNEGAWLDLLTVNSSGAVVSTSSISGASYYFTGAKGSLYAAADGSVGYYNYAGTASLGITVSATGGAAVASHAISLAQDATTKVGTAPVGFFTVANTTDSEVCTFSLIGTGVVAELSDSGGNCSATKDNAATMNVYYFTDGVYVQNKKAAEKSVRLILNGV